MSPVHCALVPPSPLLPSVRRHSGWPLRGLASAALSLALGLLGPLGSAAAADAPAATTPAAAKKPTPSKGKRPKRPKGSTPSQIMANLLLEKSDGVQDCAAKNALDKGANKVTVEAKVTVNNRGQVIDVQTKVILDKGDGAPVRECVESLIKSIKFPAGEGPLVTVERNWTIASS